MLNDSQLTANEKLVLEKIDLLLNFFHRKDININNQNLVNVFRIRGGDLGYYNSELDENEYAGNQILNIVHILKDKGLNVEQVSYELCCQPIIIIQEVEVLRIFGKNKIELIEKLDEIKNSILNQNHQIYKITFIAKKRVIKKGKHKSEDIYGYFVNEDYNDFKEFRNKRNPVIKLAELALGEIQSIDKSTGDTINRTSCAIYMKGKYKKTTIITPNKGSKFSISKNVQVKVISEKELTKIKNKKSSKLDKKIMR